VAALPPDRSCVMMIRLSLIAGFVLFAVAGTASLQAETLLVQRVQQERGIAMPSRGMSMAQVEHQFGNPANKLGSAGGDAPTHPVINRWVYDRFTVYFERDHVIDSVVNRASPTEIGPKGTDAAK